MAFVTSTCERGYASVIQIPLCVANLMVTIIPRVTKKEFMTIKRETAHDKPQIETPRERGGALEAARETVKEVKQENLPPANLALLATAFAQISEGVVITDPLGTIQYVNSAFTRITGYSAEEAVGQNPRLLKSGRQDPAYYQILWDTVLAGETWRGELINRRKDGSLYIDKMTITPVRNASGAITNFIAIKQDMTESRITEAPLDSSKKK